MSNYGIQWKTNANNMAIASEGYGLVYLGQGWNQGYVDRGPTYAPVCTAYLVSSMYDPIVFIEAPSGVTSRVVSINHINTTAWVVIVASISGNTLSTTTPTRYEPIVHIFARLPMAAPSEQFGLLIRDGSGQRAWDSRENMLSVRALIDWPEQSFADGHMHQQSFTFPATIARPAHCGFGSVSGESSIGPNYLKYFYQHAGGFQLNNGDMRRQVMVDNWSMEDLPVIGLRVNYKQECSLIIDVADYV